VRALGAVVLLVVVACGDHPAAPAPATSALAVTASPPASAPRARRPTRRFYLGRTEARCEVYFVDGDVFSVPESTPCPLDLLPGERMRIAGRTCMRESSDQAREIPVVCPDALTNREKIERGEKPRPEPAASASAP
jgi:hypothetical protein